MEQHPIPQNITGFEFKLIGDMTIKQFAYLAAGAIVAYIFFVTPLHPLLRFPLIIFTILLAIGLAFIPIEGRPLDRWISNFIRALFTPSQYLYHKKGAMPEYLKTLAPSPRVLLKAKPSSESSSKNPMSTAHRTQAQARLITLMQSESPPAPIVDEKEQDELAAINEAFSQAPTPLVTPLVNTTPVPTVKSQEAPKPPPAQIPLATPVLSGFSIPSYQKPSPPSTPLPQQKLSTPVGMDPHFEEKLRKQRELEEENQKLKEELETLKKKLLQPQLSTTPQEAPAHIMEEALAIENKLHEALSEKEKLSGELTKLKNTAMTQAQSQAQAQAVSPTPAPPIKQGERVKVISAQMAKQAGIIGISNIPNVISGIVKDARGEILPGIIVEVKDATGSPVRAFKTNKLGQFYGATPLATGKYTIELEDPRSVFSFDVIGVELTGVPFQPIEITAKDHEKEKTVNERHQLYHSLFGNQSTTPAMSS